MSNLYNKQREQYAETWDPDNLEQVLPRERFWVVHYIWLKNRGYLLRPRYHPNWVPSWKGSKKVPYGCEDCATSRDIRGRLLDAIRISDGKPVALKMIFKSKRPHEAEIMSFLSSEPLASDPMNHCVPTLDILEVPNYNGDMFLIVMPLLRDCKDPRFETIGESVEFFRQIFEGLQFLHKHHIVHRDCTTQNIMMDPSRMYPKWYHPIHTDRNREHTGSPKQYTRTERPPKYLLVDFGLSRRYDPNDGPPREHAIRGRDTSVPEFQGEKYYNLNNPFPTDVYYLGNMIKKEFLDKAVFGFDFMSSLVADMMQEEPSKRPPIDEVVTRFRSIYRSLSTSHLRLRLVKRTEVEPLRWWRNSLYFFRRLRFILQRIPPVPRTGTAYSHLQRSASDLDLSKAEVSKLNKS